MLMWSRAFVEARTFALFHHKKLFKIQNRKMKTFAFQLLLCLLLLSKLTSAQNTVSGLVSDASGKPLPFATILLITASDSSLVRGDFSSAQGGFLFENIPAGNYRIACSMLGFEQHYSPAFNLTVNAAKTELEPVVLEENSAALSEITVLAKRPFLEQKIDRTIVNVANSIANAGGTALQVLQRSPGVQVNNLTKSISLSGKEGVVVMINGKISRQPADAIVQMLEGMNADNIDRIELIHTPPANFEAEGNAGIINIILKSSGDEGFNGGYSAKAGYGFGPKYGAGAYFNYRKNKVNFFGNYDYDFNLNPQIFTNYRGVRQGADFLETDTYSDRPHTPTGTQNARLGADFQISQKTIVGVLGTFFDRNWYMEAVNDVVYSRNGTVESRLRMPNTETNHNRSIAGNVNLSHRISANQTLNLDADVVQYDISNPSHYTLQNQDAAGNPVSQSELAIDKKTPIRVMVGKADYTLSVGENVKLETGAKVTFLRFDNDVRVESREPGAEWQVIPDLTSLFHLDEDVVGAYGAGSWKINNKTDLKAGLRYEYTNTNLGSEEQPNVVDRRYGSWFPSVFLSRKITENQKLNLSYSRRITRPSIRRLAPWLVFSDPTTLEGGNPALQASFTDALKLAYTLKSLHVGVSYGIERGPMRFVPKVDPVTNRQVNTYENLDNEKVLGASLSFPVHPVRWWTIQNNFFLNSREINFKLEGQSLQIRNLDYGFNMTHAFQLPNRYTLEISGNYDSPGYWGVAFWKATGSVNLGLEKNFGDQWGKLRISASDLFVDSNWFGETRQPDINLLVKSSFQIAERTFILSWTNTFGNKKLKSARDRQTGSAEEMRRI